MLKNQNVGLPISEDCLNVKSVRNNSISVTDYVVSQSIDVSAATQLWLRINTNLSKQNGF